MNTTERQHRAIWKRCIYLGLSATLSLLFGCGTFNGNQEPEWVANPKIAYPEADYLVAVGAGDTRRAAENAAAANLSRIFEARIESDERLFDQTTETLNSFEHTSDYSSDVNILSSQTLINIQHAEAWKDALGRYHAVAYLNRRETSAIYRENIDQETTRVNFLLASADEAENLLKKYATLRAAARQATEADNLLRQLKVIHPRSVPSMTPSYSKNKLSKALADTAKQIYVNVHIEGDTAKRITAAIEQFITSYGFVVGTPTVLDIGGTVSVNDTGEREQELVFVRYELDLQIKDAQGNVLVSVGNSGRDAHKTLAQARTRSFRTLENAIQTSAAQRLDAYFDSLIDQQ